MAEIILVTGGARSGKSSHAQDLGESLPGRKLYIATCPPGLDDEMQRRIERHRRKRQDRGWHTIEEAIDPAGVLLEDAQHRTVMVDCLTLWISNLLLQDNELDEDQVTEKCEELLAAAQQRQGTVIIVTNEVGCGVVPENETARRFRDLIGRCNQVIAAGADEVVLLVSGIPQTIKGTK